MTRRRGDPVPPGQSVPERTGCAETRDIVAPSSRRQARRWGENAPHRQMRSKKPFYFRVLNAIRRLAHCLRMHDETKWQGHDVTRDRDPAASYVKGEILSYLCDVPHAADTVEGIADWWIYRQRLRWAQDTVQVAVDALVAEGRLLRIERADGQVLYAAHPPPAPP